MFEAVESRDGDKGRFEGKGVLRAVSTVETEIRATVLGLDPEDQHGLDTRLIELDGTPNKSRLGANALLGVPSPQRRRRPPTEACRCIGGWAASRRRQNSIDLQEFMLVPAGAESFAEAIRLAAETYQTLKSLLHERGLSTGVGDEGGFAPDLPSSEAAITTILQAIERAGHTGKVVLALDAAPSGLFSDGIYHLSGEGRELDTEAMIEMYEGFVTP